jgi:hypothetical protein
MGFLMRARVASGKHETTKERTGSMKPHLYMGTSINLISRAIGVVRSMLAIRTYV